MDFYEIKLSPSKYSNRKDEITIKPSFKYGYVKDLIVKGGEIKGFWYDNKWHSDINMLIQIIDNQLWDKQKELSEKSPHLTYIVHTLRDDDTGLMTQFLRYLKQTTQSDIVFNRKIFFSEETPSREDYSTYKLAYTPAPGDAPTFNEMLNHLYSPEERDKILWFMGALMGNHMSDIQKFMYLYGAAGTGKGTVIKMFKYLVGEYWATIDLEVLTGNSAFATSQVQEIPLLIDDDSDISKIKKDTNLLKLTAHETISVNAKYLMPYETEFHGLLITASNQRYSARDAAAGINRRAVVVEPSGASYDSDTYRDLMKRMQFEVPAIAQQAMDFFDSVGPGYYDDYISVDMLEARVGVFDFVKEYEAGLSDPMTLKHVSELYRLYLEENGWETKGFKKAIRNGLVPLFYEELHSSKRINGEVMRNVLTGYKPEVVNPKKKVTTEESTKLVIESTNSLFDKSSLDFPAQYTSADGTPKMKWDEVETTLKDIDTTELHYVRVPANHIVIDFDIKNNEGEKDLELNLEAASKYPLTYSEISKSGQGVHLHYLYDGDVSQLASLAEDDVEIKVFTGKSSLRRKLTYCNEEPISHIATGLPIKEEKVIMKEDVENIMWNEKKLRTAVEKNLRKEYHDATKPSIDFIAHLLSRAEIEGVKFDLTDLRQDVMAFALSSSNQAPYCMKVASKINFKTIDEEEVTNVIQTKTHVYEDEELVFFDVEVYPNLFVVAWRKLNTKMNVWINPTAMQIEKLLENPIVGFNNRRYDNHILYAAAMGASHTDLFNLSQGIINNTPGAAHGAAYELSYADIFEYNSKKQSLKKWEVELGIKHDEMDIPWDQPVDPSLWKRVGEYCSNDVDATVELFLETKYDYVARKILAHLSGLSINATTTQHAARFLFGDDPRPQDKFVYTDLSERFPGYKYSFGKSEYRGEDPSEGGYVYSEPGVYENVGLYDVVSMHPNSLINMNYFGPYTEKYENLKDTRVMIKHGDFKSARESFGGALIPFLEDESDAKDLAFAMKIIINIVYGMTSAKFDNKFRHPKNLDNIVAKRGALFMIDLKHAVQEKGFTVVHIKTDSIKVANPTDELTEFIFKFGAEYGYEFELEHVYKRMALVNKAVYIAQLEDDTWEATGSQFAEPFVFKTLFSHGKVNQLDFAITKAATVPIYIDDQFIGKVAQVYASKTGGEMKRVAEDKVGAITGTKGFKWKLYSELEDKDDIDMNYYEGLVKSAIEAIDKVGPAHKIIDEAPVFLVHDVLPF